MKEVLNDIYTDGCKEKKYRLSDFFNRWWDEYAQHPAEYITPEQYKAVNAIRVCRTTTLGIILPANLRAIFNKVIVNESFLKGWFDLENYPVIQEKLGTPDYDECFGYSLLLALGGSEDIENIKIVKTIPYIDICTQTIGEFEVADKW